VRRATREVKRVIRIPALIIIIGAAASALILKIGISAARSKQSKQFKHQSKDLVHEFGKAWDQYTAATLWVQQASRSGKQTREEFHTLYRYLLATGLEFHPIASLTNVTHDERATFENDTRTFISQTIQKAIIVALRDKRTIPLYMRKSALLLSCSLRRTARRTLRSA
jgi:hypothetical protein